MDDCEWELPDQLLAVIRGRSYRDDEVLTALITCMAKAIVKASRDDQMIADMLGSTKSLLVSAVQLQKAKGPEGKRKATPSGF